MNDEDTAASTTARADTEKPIPIIEEELEISKKETIQEAKVIKEPKIEFKEVEVEVIHEELIIEKQSVDKRSLPTSLTSEEIAQSKTEISIPLKKEDIIVEKKPYVKEEIVIKKKPVTETKTISEQLISEKASVRNAAGEENNSGNNIIALYRKSHFFLKKILLGKVTQASGDGFSDGFRQGKMDGENDAKAGLPSHVRCGSEHSTSYCLGYRAGYVSAYDLWKVSHSH
jgi:uncharacterized protein (TIGR02271 family)